MIPGLRRLKVGALQLGADEPGLPGPLDAWTGQGGQEDEHDPAGDDPAEPHC
ncbi:hypothetical protein [Kitasatospora sp. CB01950]|uniref:hypothetical protein n=1 Tax=Kitasatospora sp. CB01950 TaxID=1703930 RepID=UPI0013018D2C|nr:hypothetical protein [Kitasatospora sp. CB01950]